MKFISIEKAEITQDEARKILSLLQFDTTEIDNYDEISKQSVSFRRIEQVFGLTPKVKGINNLIEEELSNQFEQAKAGILEETLKRIEEGEQEVRIPLSNFIELLLIFRKWHSFFDSVWINIQLVKEFIHKNKIVVEVNSDLDITLDIYSEYDESDDTLSYYFDLRFVDLPEKYNQ